MWNCKLQETLCSRVAFGHGVLFFFFLGTETLRVKLEPGYVILLFCSDKSDRIFGRVVEGLGTLGWKSYRVLRDQSVGGFMEEVRQGC